MHTIGCPPSELHLALCIHLRNFGDRASMVLHRCPLEELGYFQPRTEPGIWFHDLPALATIQGTI